MKTFGENLQQLMKEKRLSVKDISEGVGVPQKTVQEWVGSGGRTPRNLEAIKRLGLFLSCSVHFLLYGEEDPSVSLSVVLEKTDLHTGLYEITIRKVKQK